MAAAPLSSSSASCPQSELPSCVVSGLIACDLPLTCLELYAELQSSGRPADVSLLQFARARATGATVDASAQLASKEYAPPSDGKKKALQEAVALLRHNGCVAEADEAAKKLGLAIPGDHARLPLPPVEQLLEANVKLEARLSHVMRVLGDRLPTVMESIHTDRKESVIPLALAAIEFHDVAAMRRSLLYHLLHMHRRPSTEQRSTLLKCLRSLSESLQTSNPPNAALRIEEEIVSEVLQLRDHRYAEMRCVCAASPLTFDGIVSPATASYLASQVSLPLSSDPSSLVRAQVATTLPVCAKAHISLAIDDIIQTTIRLALDSKRSVAVAATTALDDVLTECARARKLLTVAVPLIIGSMLTVDATSLSVVSYESAPRCEILSDLLTRALRTALTCHDKKEPCISESSLRTLLDALWNACFSEVSDQLREKLAVALAMPTSALASEFEIQVTESFDRELARVATDGNARRRWLVFAIMHHSHATSSAAARLLPPLIADVGRRIAPWNDADAAMCVTSLAKALGDPSSSAAVTNAFLVLVTTADSVNYVYRLALQTVERAAPSLRESQAVTALWPVLAALIDRGEEEDSRRVIFGEAVETALSLGAFPSFVSLLDLLFPCVLSVVEAHGWYSAQELALLQSLAHHALRLPSQHREKYTIPHLTAACAALVADRPPSDAKCKAQLTRAVLDVFTSLTVCPSLGFVSLNEYLLPALRSIAKDCCGDAGSNAVALRNQHAMVLKTLVGLEAKARPRQAMSFLDKVKHELSSIVK